MQNTNPIPLVVADVAIRTDAEGRYCLNDLHNAAGDLPKDQPAKYFANQQAKDLISEIGDHSVHVVRGYGKEQGTYVCKELVYAYAMWISPAFSLKVIRAYDAIRQDTDGRLGHDEKGVSSIHTPGGLGGGIAPARVDARRLAGEKP